jgi:pimeloyl-ACP methyl ester carboxylesterase
VTCGRGRQVEANGLRLQLYEWGRPAAPPALLLHSLAAHSHWWDWTAPLVADRFHVVALDLRGHGGSDWSEPPAYRAADHVSDIIAVLAQLGWRSPLVIGHSLGGYVGLHLAALHPDRVGALVIVDTMMQWSDEETAWAMRNLDRPEAEFASPAEAVARYRLRPSETTAPADVLGHLAGEAVTQRRPGVYQYAFDRRVFAHARPQAWPILPGVLCPTLVVRGAGSPIMDRESWLRAATTVKRGQFAEVKGAFHHLILDDPPQFVAIVDRWLARSAAIQQP